MNHFRLLVFTLLCWFQESKKIIISHLITSYHTKLLLIFWYCIILHLISSYDIISCHVVSHHPLVTILFSYIMYFQTTPSSYYHLSSSPRLLSVFLPARCPEGFSHSHDERSQTNTFLFSTSCVGKDSRKDGWNGPKNYWNQEGDDVDKWWMIM